MLFPKQATPLQSDSPRTERPAEGCQVSQVGSQSYAGYISGTKEGFRFVHGDGDIGPSKGKEGEGGETEPHAVWPTHTDRPGSWQKSGSTRLSSKTAESNHARFKRNCPSENQNLVAMASMARASVPVGLSSRSHCLGHPLWSSHAHNLPVYRAGGGDRLLMSTRAVGDASIWCCGVRQASTRGAEDGARSANPERLPRAEMPNASVDRYLLMFDRSQSGVPPSMLSCAVWT